MNKVWIVTGMIDRESWVAKVFSDKKSAEDLVNYLSADEEYVLYTIEEHEVESAND